MLKRLRGKMKNKKEIEKMKPKIVKVLKKNGVSKAGIFGSYARGEQNKKSDVDILVEIKNDNLSLLGFIGVQQELEDKIKKKVDLVEYKVLHHLLRERILAEEVRII